LRVGAPPLRALCEHFKDRSAASITPEEATAWIQSLVTAKRSARVVKKTWLNAATTIYRWATAHKHVSRNPFADVKVTVPKKRSVRDTPAFYTSEWRTILKASLAITDISTPDERCKRWVPWLCAYTGARSGEITQLRGGDVIKRDGIHAIQITPSAGTVKSGRAHVVPLHEHLIAQGFLKFVVRYGNGPLFYNPNPSKRSAASAADPTKQKKPRAAQARQRLAKWVRSLGVTDTNIGPNHAWRHLFKRLANRADISERMSDAITGHAPKSEGARYGAPTIEDMAAALKRFPRYKLK
jgi:integrase